MITLHTEKLAVIGIETASSYPNFETIQKESPKKAKLWQEYYEKQISSKENVFTDTLDHEHAYKKYGGLYADYGRITNITITVYLTKSEKHKGEPKIVSLSCVGSNEKEIILRANKIISNKIWIGGHNITNFIIPFLSRRSIINGVRISENINVTHKKPWDMNILDTMNLWSFGSKNTGTSSLASISSSLDIGDVDKVCRGCDMSFIFWKDRDFQKIADHCENNTSIVMKTLLRFANPEIDTDIIPVHNMEPEVKTLDSIESFFVKQTETQDIF